MIKARVTSEGHKSLVRLIEGFEHPQLNGFKLFRSEEDKLFYLPDHLISLIEVLSDEDWEMWQELAKPMESKAEPSIDFKPEF